MKRLLAATALSCMAGCTVFQNHARREVSLIGSIGTDTNVLATTADVRLVTERTRAGSGGTISVLCTEPSPDVAKAISAAGSFSANGGNTTTKGALSVAGGSAEAVAELAGRSTALLALRDGLYHACEAYANGALGPDAYALVLARYGQLLTTLFLAQDITSAVAGVSELDAARASLASPSPVVPSPDSSSSQDTTSNSQQDSKPSNKPATTSPSTQSAADPPSADPPAADPPAASQQVKQPATPPASSPPKSGMSNSQGTGAAAPSAASVAAVALARMNEDYEDLDLTPVQLLVVACVNQGDPSRPDTQKNTWLTEICPKLEDPNAIGSLITAANTSVKSFGRPGAALDVLATMTGEKNAPGATAVSSLPAAPPASKSTSKVKVSASSSAARAKVVAAQWALFVLHYNVGHIDGVVGPQTQDATRLFQMANKLPMSGEFDAATLAALMVPANKAPNARQPVASRGK